jgi:hypothetical protein
VGRSEVTKPPLEKPDAKRLCESDRARGGTVAAACITAASMKPKSSTPLALAAPQQLGVFQDCHIPSGASRAKPALSASPRNLAISPSAEQPKQCTSRSSGTWAKTPAEQAAEGSR